MKSNRIVVVGGLAAGPSAAAKAARVNPRAEVILLEASETVSYGICETPYVIGTLIASEASLVSYTPERLAAEKHIQVHTLHSVERINPSHHTVVVRDIRQATTRDIVYDKLILATGSRPRKLGLPGEDARNLFRVKFRDDILAILSFLEKESPKSAVIIGGGYVGLELAEALVNRGLDVTLLHQSRLPLAGLEESMRKHILEELTEHGVRFSTNTKVDGFIVSPSGRLRAVHSNKGTFEGDVFFSSIGVEPNLDLARSAKLRIGPAGAIRVDERQHTSADDIYAAGDCCEIRNSVIGKPMYLPLATYASRTGRVAGENAAGGKASFKGAIRAIAVKVFDLEVAQVGVSAEEALAAGLQPVVESVSSYTTIKLMPGSAKMTVLLIVDRSTKRVIGANIIGGAGSAARANTLSVAIQHRLTIDEVANLDLLYAPPFSPLWDPVLTAAMQSSKKISPR